MNILMLTNTYEPFVGGVPRSVGAFARELRKEGHRVIVVAPALDQVPDNEEDVIRIPAIQHFNGSDFAVVLPIPGYLHSRLGSFKPDIVHTHHPHLLGSTALRMATWASCPLLFTYHTMYEDYLHYVPAHAQRLRQFVVSFVTGYCNLCDHVVVPSQSIARILQERGVRTPSTIIPTGVYPKLFQKGDRRGLRRCQGIPDRAFVAGYVGRLAPEKNLGFLAEAACRFVAESQRSHFLVVGSGPSENEISRRFIDRRLAHRLHLAGSKTGQELADAYHAMDVFIFASQTETQGMVLTEAMAAGRPVIALDAPGVREVVRNGYNGFLLDSQDSEAFARCIAQLAAMPKAQIGSLQRHARNTAQAFSMDRSVHQLTTVYEGLLQNRRSQTRDETAWTEATEAIKAEWEIIKNVAEAAAHAFV
jgi:1,2-diacylglycerol 3-alpha-glucosyltransferase